VHLLPHSGGVIAILPRELLMPTLARLRKFVLRAKVQIDDAGGLLTLAGQHGTRTLESAGMLVPHPEAGYAEHDGIAVGLVARGSNRYWVIGAEAALAERGLAGDPSGAPQIERDWRLADIRAGLPQVYTATQELFVAQMLNLDLIDGISFSKGCFTGQEIIARTQHLGRIKRRLFRLQLPPGDWCIGQSLRLADGRAGRLTELAAIGEGFEALAVLNVETGMADHAPAASTVSSVSTAPAESAAATVAARELPLPYQAQPQ
jgi:folate-binding protein YgfZ